MARKSLRRFHSIALRIPTTHDFSALARANKRMHLRNERNFPQAKLDSEINARFLLNKHGKLYYCLIIVYMLSSLI